MSADDTPIVGKLTAMKIDMAFEHSKVKDIVAFIHDFTDLNVRFKIDARRDQRIYLKVADLELGSVLELLTIPLGWDVKIQRGELIILEAKSTGAQVALEQLEGRADPKSVRTLTRWATTPSDQQLSDDLRTGALIALIRINIPESREALGGISEHLDPDARLRLVFLLGQYGNRDAIPVINQILKANYTRKMLQMVEHAHSQIIMRDDRRRKTR